ncbi:glycosyltransferase family 2 protein [Levilactobacillus spicheri]|uniref:Bactoprenol glucosyl transferase n=2 Tax=Levilactobacillus spicheri TaxID=216463 RepID=A0A0F3RP14_9LACO|nr:glycosyltransferase family 2 protein [Levilactobacillus spicheri]KJW11701.1 glucosyl transferase family 2 [Levilactobacillus spicheri]KRL46264.1 glycosyltransferase-like protein [Levilactobacillus spicheri DSM 15429]GEO67127.1 bactoprenol glucosyl transferase [Levilactobacillus spicheri]
MKKISLVVPCYNEEESIPLFFQAVSKVIDSMNTPTPTVTPEYIFVDDGSSDNTLAEMKQLNQAHPTTVHYRSFSRNFGKESGLAAGLEAATGDYVAVMDVDLQDPPELLPKMFQLVDSGEYDCVGTIQKERRGQSKLRAFLSSSFYRVINKISDVQIKPNARDYRLMNRQFVDTVLSLPEFNRFSKGIFSWVGFKTTYLTYESQPRAAGTTHWSLGQLFSYSIEGIIDFSNVPLRIATWVGSISFFLSLIGLVFVIVRALTVGGSSVAGWPSLVVIMLLIGGIQLFCLGILGQYINKIYLETKHRPKYIIREEK